MSLTKAVLRFAAPLPKIEAFERVLFIGPHPDDIEIGAGATAAKLAAQGKEICFLICIDGRYGSGKAPEGVRGEALARLRQEEARRSAQVLGVEDVRFLGLCDGGFYREEELLSGLASVIGDFGPELVFAPDPWVRSECHADHLNVGRAAMRLACFSPYGDIMARYGAKAAPVQALALYMTARPNRFVDTKGFHGAQDRAIACHESQFPPGDPEGASIRTYLKLRSLDFGLRSLKGQAEGFRVLGATHMHCLPEAGE